MTQKNEKLSKEQLLNKELEQALIKTLEKEQHISWRDHETLMIGKDQYKVITDFRDALDIDQLSERYIDYLNVFDYIVGDIASEKLRLRGFYDEHRKNVREDQWISHLDEYIIEYCNFGASYFVLERVEKLESIPNKTDSNDNQKRKQRTRKRRRNTRRRNQRRSKNQNKHTFKKENRSTSTSSNKKETKHQNKKPNNKSFQIRPINESK